MSQFPGQLWVGVCIHYMCNKLSKIYVDVCVRWRSSSLAPSWWVHGKSHKAREEQNQIFSLSHLLGSDPEEVSLHTLQEELKRNARQQALHLPWYSEITSNTHHSISQPLYVVWFCDFLYDATLFSGLFFLTFVYRSGIVCLKGKEGMTEWQNLHKVFSNVGIEGVLIRRHLVWHRLIC